MPTTREILAFALELADLADDIALAAYRSNHDVERKPDGSFVTPADRAAEARLRARIAEQYPDHAVLGEEEGDDPAAAGSPARWILDPIDGTHSFMRGIPVWASLIACERGGMIEVGVVSAPALGTRWWAGRGLGAFRGPAGPAGAPGAEQIRASEVARIDEAKVSCGDIVPTLDVWPGARELLEDCWRVRSYADFWGFCLVAEGAVEVMLDGADLSPWDVAALVPIVEEAGGRFLGRAAGPQIATNQRLHAEVVRRLTDPGGG